jgi:hypothetical protein
MGEAKNRKKEIDLIKLQSKGPKLAEIDRSDEGLRRQLTETGSGVFMPINHVFGKYIIQGLPSNRQNRCYEVTQWVRSRIPKTTWTDMQCNIFEGEVRMTKYADNIRSGHAWIEFIDENGEFCVDVVSAVTVEKKDYYRAFDVTGAVMV